jgi:Flp pilus assembly pilin Flp
MELITKLYVRAREFKQGQTMTEYALILAAVAVVVLAGYQTMGGNINGMINTIDGNL